MKKKLLVTMLALALAASSVACGAQKVEPATNNNAESEASAEAAPYPLLQPQALLRIP